MSAEPSTQMPLAPSPARAAIARAAGFFALWLVLMHSAKPADLAFGAIATGIATWVSVRLLPPATGGVRFGALLALVPHLLWESLRAGIDVAHRALAPRMPLDPGFVRCPLNFPPGFTRNTFATITSLLPGTVPSGEDDGVLVYHCLDMNQQVVEGLSEEERLLARGLVIGRRHG
jgi:multicomponent Na+:H+ antiporter subunit E